ncbi:MAG: Alpha/Beta hydrolase protein [Linnemannia gamsii]|nr:MAG: Alpha/Beta hydrolase protein [Linnemannia gamsii]
MSAVASTTVRSGLNIVRHVVPASTPSFKLACNTYRRTIPLPSPITSTPPIIFTHANGFHKEIWEPVITRLSPPWANSDMYAFDCRNQGDSAVLNKDVLEKDFDWYSYAHDILKIVDTFGLKKAVGVGHSFGASAFFLAEVMRPGTFSAIVAVDPTNFPKEIYMNAPIDDHPMAQLTLKRRDTWKSREECKANLLQKKFFKAWHPEALDLYIEHGMLDVVNEDGSTGITLKCPKYQEATTFACVGTGLSDSFEKMDEIQIPIHIVSGEDSDINPEELVRMKLARCQHGSLEIMKGVGHLLSLEKPQETADQISGFLDRILESPAEQEQLKARL